ncbi:MAG TPA: hypothetical protein VH590_20970 [Ktedonobacterales bacterium]|jgi:hypothetical protein
MEEAEDELARLRAENARLRAMIDRLERAGGNEPAPLAAETQIIKAGEVEEAPAPVKTTRSPERPKRPRKKRTRKQKKASPFQGWLSCLLMFGGSAAAYGILLVLSLVLSDYLQTFNFWSLLFGGLIIGPLILAIAGGITSPIRELRARRPQASLPKKPRQRPRRITRKLRAPTTQKLDTE